MSPVTSQAQFITDALIDPADLIAILQASRRAHSQYQLSKRDGNPEDAYQWLLVANTLRIAAQALDPGYVQLIWKAEPRLKFRHQEVLDFYTQQIARHG